MRFSVRDWGALLSLRQWYTLLYAVLLLCAMATIWLLLSLQGAHRNANQAQEQRYQSMLLAQELRQSSEDLTRFARTYVVTADVRFARYYQQVLDIRNGVLARPRDYLHNYWDRMAAGGAAPRPDAEGRYVAPAGLSLHERMRLAGFTAEEFAKLDDAEQLSNRLVSMEAEAMQMVQGYYRDSDGRYIRSAKPNREAAQQLLHSAEYHRIKGAIMQPIGLFMTMVEARTDHQRASAERQVERNGRLLMIPAVAVVVLLCAVLLLTRARLLGNVDRLAARIRELERNHDLVSDMELELDESLRPVLIGYQRRREETLLWLSRCKLLEDRVHQLADRLVLITVRLRGGMDNVIQSDQAIMLALQEVKTSLAGLTQLLGDVEVLGTQARTVALEAREESLLVRSGMTALASTLASACEVLEQNVPSVELMPSLLERVQQLNRLSQQFEQQLAGQLTADVSSPQLNILLQRHQEALRAQADGVASGLGRLLGKVGLLEGGMQRCLSESRRLAQVAGHADQSMDTLAAEMSELLDEVCQMQQTVRAESVSLNQLAFNAEQISRATGSHELCLGELESDISALLRVCAEVRSECAGSVGAGLPLAVPVGELEMRLKPA